MPTFEAKSHHMRHPRILYTRAARRRLQALPPEVRLHVETHLENLVLLVRASPPAQLPQLLARGEEGEEGFVTAVPGARVHYVIDAVARTLLIHRLEALPGSERGSTSSAP